MTQDDLTDQSDQYLTTPLNADTSHTDNTSNNNEFEATVHIEAVVAQYVDRIGGTFVLFGGMTGNIISIQVLRRPRLRHSTTSLYLSTLAMVDLWGLLAGQGGRHWIRSMTGYDLPSHFDWYCKAWYPLVGTALAVSDWILAGVSAERCLAIWFPLKVKMITSRTKAKCFMLITFVIMAIWNTISALMSYEKVMGSNGPTCGTKNNRFAVDFRPWINFCIQSLCPALIIIIANVLLIVKVADANRRRHKNLQQQKQSHPHQQMATSAGEAEVRSLLLMLITISIAFVVLTSPLHILWVVQKSYKPSNSPATKEVAVNRLVWSIVLFLVYLNHGINFLLYVISGREFRREVRDWSRETCCIKQKHPLSVSSSQDISCTQNTDTSTHAI